MIDPFGRKITYLRVSVTDRCDFRCVYCMSEDMTFLPKRDVLSLEEMDRMCSAFIRRGVRKLRLTGGEPLVRRNIMGFIESLSRHLATGDLDEITLTTNGTQLPKYAHELAACGVKRINVSLDTLNPEKFHAITRWGTLDKTLEGLAAAKDAGLAVKINTVAVRDFNEDEVNALIEWCGEKGFDITFIETMPLGDIGGDRVEQYRPLSDVRRSIEKTWTLTDNDVSTGGPARYADIAQTGRKIGFITPMSHTFCETCNRVRVTCTGTLYTCLGHDNAVDLREPIRASESDIPLLATIDAAIENKPKGHDFIIERGVNSPLLARHMSVTGG